MDFGGRKLVSDEVRNISATSSRIKKAAAEGLSPGSGEFFKAFSLFAFLVTAAVFGKYFLECIRETVSIFIEMSVNGNPDSSAAALAFGCFVRVCVPFLAVMASVAWLTEVSQVGFVFNPGKRENRRIKINMSPAARRTRLLIRFIRIPAVAAAVFFAVREDFNTLVRMTDLMFTFVFMGKVLLYVGTVILVSAAADYLAVRFFHREALKMTEREFREEQREENGDPAVKARLDKRMKQLLS